MAFTIRIYEKDNYIYSLLKRRLISFFPDAYIVNPYFDEEDYEDRFSTSTRILYNPSDVNSEDVSYGSASPIRLTEDSGIIDCSRLIRLLRSEEVPAAIKRSVSGSVYAVLPFVCSEARERYIKSLSSGLSDADFNIRLDFTSKLRALRRDSAGCNMTGLLEACRSKKFDPEDILKFCNMDESGFLTPGTTKDYDDVYDLGTARSVTLINHAASLAHSKGRTVNVLNVIEGFRTKELPELLSVCDKITLLFPSVNEAEETGTQDLIALLTRTLGKERLSVRYSEEFLPSEKYDDTLPPRRLVV